MKVPAALFPYNPELLPAIKLFEALQSKYTLRELIAPSGYGLTGRDPGYSRNHPPIGLMVTDALDLADPMWDLDSVEAYACSCIMVVCTCGCGVCGCDGVLAKVTDQTVDFNVNFNVMKDAAVSQAEIQQ